jgi:hypothetical protein
LLRDRAVEILLQPPQPKAVIVTGSHRHGFSIAFSLVSRARRYPLGTQACRDSCSRRGWLHPPYGRRRGTRFFPISVGVANVKDFLNQLDPPPAFVTSTPGRAGFAEFAAALLQGRRIASAAARGKSPHPTTEVARSGACWSRSTGVSVAPLSSAESARHRGLKFVAMFRSQCPLLARAGGISESFQSTSSGWA